MNAQPFKDLIIYDSIRYGGLDMNKIRYIILLVVVFITYVDESKCADSFGFIYTLVVSNVVDH